MTETPDTRVVAADCLAWNTKNNGKPEGGNDSKPVQVQKGTVVTVYGVSVEVEPRALLVKTSEGRTLEIRESCLVEPAG